MDYLNSVGDIFDWIANLGNSATNTIVNVVTDPVNNIQTFGADFFDGIGNAVTAGISSILYFLFKEPMGFLAGLLHFLQLAGDLINYLIAPFWYLANFLSGFFTYISMPAAIVAANNAFNNNAVNAFLLAFPGYTELMTVVNAALWAMLAFHVLRELKHI